MKKILALVIATLFISGCGIMKCTMLDDCRSTPAAEADILNIPAKRLFSYKEPERDFASIIIIRDDNFVDSECFDLLSVNGSQVARIGIKERIELKVEPGELVIKASINDPYGPSRCNPIGDRTIIREFVISQGQTKKFRIVHNLMPMDIDIQRSE